MLSYLINSFFYSFKHNHAKLVVSMIQQQKQQQQLNDKV
jgi:hypothetical protein